VGLWSATAKYINSYIFPRIYLYFWKFAIFIHIIIFVHFLNIGLCRCSKHFDDLYELIDLRITRKRGITIDHFHQNTTSRPHINLGIIASGTKYQLRSSIASRTNVSQIRLPCIDWKLPLTSCFAEPKSDMTMRCLNLSTSMFWGLISLCAIESMER